MLYTNIMKTFPHVEDYLELLSNQDYSWLLPKNNTVDVSIKLARYDINVVNNMTDSVVWGQSLTDRQAELAVKLILKYRRQFAKFDIDVNPVATNPTYRLPLRKIDRSKSLSLVNDQLSLKFPFDSNMVEQIREFQRNSQGGAQWNHENKIWTIALTEYNVNYVTTWALKNHFDIDSEVLKIYDTVVSAENTSYEIKLIETDLGYLVTNAADSLKEYIDQNLGQNLVKLIDHAAVLGYEVDEKLLAKAADTYGQPLVDIGTQHSVTLAPTVESLNLILEYARITQRFPVCIYDPKLFDFEATQFKDHEILKFDHNGKTNTRDFNINDVKIVFARKIPSNWSWPVPLLVSTVEMMYGGRRLEWINRAEKIVYLVNANIRKTEDKWL